MIRISNLASTCLFYFIYETVYWCLWSLGQENHGHFFGLLLVFLFHWNPIFLSSSLDLVWKVHAYNDETTSTFWIRYHFPSYIVGSLYSYRVTYFCCLLPIRSVIRAANLRERHRKINERHSISPCSTVLGIYCFFVYRKWTTCIFPDLKVWPSCMFTQFT